MSDRTPEMADIIRQAIEDRLADVHTMLPGRIDRYYPSTQKADVEPLIKRLQSTVDGELNEELPIIPGVPVVFPRTRAFKMTMPVEPGDRCMMVFCESSSETYQIGDLRKGSSDLIDQADPETFERFNLTDPVALLGWYNDAEALSAVDQDGMQLGRDGGAIIHIGDDLIELYEKAGSTAEFVALATKVKTELERIANDITTLKLAFQAWVVAPNDGGAALKAATLSWSTTALTPQAVAASKVKAT